MTIAAARSAFRSSAARGAAARFSSKAKSAPSASRLPSGKPLAQRLCRSPVRMIACMDSFQPYHTATASALMMSMLIVARCGFGWLSEGFKIEAAVEGQTRKDFSYIFKLKDLFLLPSFKIIYS